MVFDFQIPVARDDLLSKTCVNQYSVDEILTHRLVPGAVQDFKFAVRSDPFAIVDNFDSIFSVLFIQRELDTTVKEEIWDLLIKGARNVVNHISSVIDESGIQSDTRIKNLNLFKMTTYLLCQYMEMFENEHSKACEMQINVGKGRGRKLKKPVDATIIDWDRERETGLQVLLQIVQLNLPKLWDPPIAEEEFVSLVSNICYKLLENTDINRLKGSRDVIPHIIGCLVKRYNHAFGASLKVIQLLQHFEHLVTPLVLMVEILVNNYGTKSIVSEIMREIGRLDPQDLSRDTAATRSYSLFLVELAERIPSVILPNISVLLGHLDGDSYSMRNGVLGMLGEIVIRLLSKEDLDENLKKTRDNLFDKLEEHLHDVHAFGRSKVLQIWLNIVNAKCLPLPRQSQLVSHVIGRIQDKSSQVRKYAIQLITVLIKCNPFAAQLPMEQLVINYEKELEKLHEMEPDNISHNEIEVSILDGFEKEWHAVEGDVRDALATEDKLLGVSQDDDSSDDEKDDEVTLNRQLQRIYQLLLSGQYLEGIRVLGHVQRKWPGLKGHSNVISSQESAVSQSDSQLSINESIQDDVNPDDDCIHQLKVIFLNQKKLGHLRRSTSESDANKDQAVSELAKQQMLVQYLKDSLTFSKQILTLVPLISQLLGSKTATDTFEAIEFFVTGFEFGVASTMLGIRRMLSLVWSRENGVKDAVIAAYKRLYLTPEGGTQRSKALAVITNLSALTEDATLGELTSLEELIVEFIKNGEIGQPVTQMLWERFTLKVPNTTLADSRAALLLLSMAAGAEMDMVKTNLEVLISEGLGPRAEEDFILARNACLALIKLGTAQKARGQTAAEPFRLPITHTLFSRLSHLLVTGVTKVDNSYWIPTAELAVNVIYKLSEQPDLICSGIIKELSAATVKCCQENHDAGGSSQSEPLSSLASCVMARLLSVVGHVALKQLVHLDVSIFGEIKRRLAAHEDNKKGKGSHKSDKSALSKTKDTVLTDTIEEEMGLTGAAAEDAESEFIRHICERQIVSGDGLLAKFTPLLVAVCSSPTKYPDEQLRTAASLALAKFMTVSSEFCESHLQLLFTVLEKSPSATIRANTIIALGDLAFRFPNLIEPWTSHLYRRLRDESPHVRKNTLQVLTHLILNDMVKVKGQISEMAICIVDHDERISNLAKLFFLELSKKGNAVYNVLADIISRLSDPDIGVDEDSFNIILKYLFSFIQKDKQCESLVEKICHRYRSTKVERQWRDLSFCLSMLSYNDKSIQKLQENFACFADKLHDETVYNYFKAILNKARLSAKQDGKTLVDELEERVDLVHEKGVEDDEATQKASKATQRRKNKTPSKTPGRRRKKSEKENGKSSSPVRQRPKKKLKSKPKLLFSSDEDSDVELFDVNKDSDEDLEDTFSMRSPVERRSIGGKVSLTPRRVQTLTYDD